MKCDELNAETIVPQGCTLTLQMYPKGEVDAAIDELKREHHRERHEYIDMVAQHKAKLVEQESENRKQKRLRDMALASVPNALKVMKIIQYQKYKRCLAMARMCEEAYNRECGLNPEEMTNKEFYKQQIEFWPRWSSKWLKIAERFKTNSTAQQG